MKQIAIPALLLGFCLIGKLYLGGRLSDPVKLIPDPETLQVAYDAASIKKYTFGFNQFIAGLSWVNLLHGAKTTPVAKGKLSWEFAQLNTITTLDPNFDSAYHYGSLLVSFYRRDQEGGKLLLEKWIQKRPNYWRAQQMLGMHYFLEMKDPAKAAPWIMKAASYPDAPQWIRSLGVGLLSETGGLLQALNLAIEIFPSTTDLEGRFRLTQRIHSLRWNLQKKRWEKAVDAFQARLHRKPTNLAEVARFLEPDRELSSLESEAPKEVEQLQTLLHHSFRFRYDPAKGVRGWTEQEQNQYEKVGVHIAD